MKTQNTTKKTDNKRRINKNLLVFIFFLVLSSVLWFLNSLNKIYTTDISIPITFVNFPENKRPGGNTPKTLKLKITAYGFEILAQKISFLKPLKVDVKKEGIILQNKKHKAYLLSDSILRNVKIYFGENIKIEKVIPDTIIFDFSKSYTKKVPVKSNINYTLNAGYMIINDIQFLPDSITISGTKEKLKKIDFVFTEYKVYKNIGRSIKETLKLLKISEIPISEEKVEVLIEVEKFTESEINIPVEILNIPESINILVFPSDIKVKYKVPLSKYKLIRKEDFKAIANFEEGNESIPEFLTVQLIKTPENINSVKIFPQKLEYIIEK